MLAKTIALDRKKILRVPIYQDAACFEKDESNMTNGRSAIYFPHLAREYVDVHADTEISYHYR